MTNEEIAELIAGVADRALHTDIKPQIIKILDVKDAEIKSLKAELEKANNYIKSFGEATNDYHQAYLKESRKVNSLRKEVDNFYNAQDNEEKHQCTKFCRPEENSHIEIKTPKSGEAY